MVRKLSMLAVICLIVLLPTASFGQEQEVPDASQLISQVLHVLGNDATTFSRMELTLHEGLVTETFAADVWTLPDGVRRVELTEPELVTGTVAIVKSRRVHLLSENERGRREYNLGAIAILFTMSDDILSPDLFTGTLWDDAKLTVGNEYSGRPVYELQTADDWGALIGVTIDAAALVPLAVYIDDGQERLELLETHELIVDADGEVVGLHVGMVADEVEGELHLERLNSTLGVRRAAITMPGLHVELQAHTIEEAILPEELTVSPGTIPWEDERWQRALVFTVEGDYEAARIELESLTRSNPYHVDAHVQLGYVYLQLGDWMGARASFEQALLLDPTDTMAANNLAYVYIESETDIERGLALAQAVVAMWPSNSSYLDTLGWGLYKVGAYEDAVVVLADAVEKSKQQLRPTEAVEVLYHYALALQAVGDLETAREVASQAFEFDPEFPGLYELLAELGL